jgi:DNA-binding transcriptional MerR regulator
MAVARVEARVNGARPGIRVAKPKGADINGGLKIGQLAREVGVTAKAIRFYEAKRVLPRATRGANGYRLYGRDALDTLTFVKRATGLGLTLAEIREIISIRDGGAPPCPHVRFMLEEKARELDRKLRDLIDMRRELRRNLAAWSRTKLRRAAVCPHIEAHRISKPLRTPTRFSAEV